MVVSAPTSPQPAPWDLGILGSGDLWEPKPILMLQGDVLRAEPQGRDTLQGPTPNRGEGCRDNPSQPAVGWERSPSRAGNQGSARGSSPSSPAPSPHNPTLQLLGSSWDWLQLLGLRVDLGSCTSLTQFKCQSITGTLSALLDRGIFVEILKPHSQKKEMSLEGRSCSVLRMKCPPKPCRDVTTFGRCLR